MKKGLSTKNIITFMNRLLGFLILYLFSFSIVAQGDYMIDDKKLKKFLKFYEAKEYTKGVELAEEIISKNSNEVISIYFNSRFMIKLKEESVDKLSSYRNHLLQIRIYTLVDDIFKEKLNTLNIVEDSLLLAISEIEYRLQEIEFLMVKEVNTIEAYQEYLSKVPVRNQEFYKQAKKLKYKLWAMKTYEMNKNNHKNLNKESKLHDWEYLLNTILREIPEEEKILTKVKIEVEKWRNIIDEEERRIAELERQEKLREEEFRKNEAEFLKQKKLSNFKVPVHIHGNGSKIRVFPLTNYYVITGDNYNSHGMYHTEYWKKHGVFIVPAYQINKQTWFNKNYYNFSGLKSLFHETDNKSIGLPYLYRGLDFIDLPKYFEKEDLFYITRKPVLSIKGDIKYGKTERFQSTRERSEAKDDYSFYGTNTVNQLVISSNYRTKYELETEEGIYTIQEEVIKNFRFEDEMFVYSKVSGVGYPTRYELSKRTLSVINPGFIVFTNNEEIGYKKKTYRTGDFKVVKTEIDLTKYLEDPKFIDFINLGKNKIGIITRTYKSIKTNTSEKMIYEDEYGRIKYDWVNLSGSINLKKDYILIINKNTLEVEKIVRIYLPQHTGEEGLEILSSTENGFYVFDKYNKKILSYDENANFKWKKDLDGHEINFFIENNSYFFMIGSTSKKGHIGRSNPYILSIDLSTHEEYEYINRKVDDQMIFEYATIDSDGGLIFLISYKSDLVRSNYLVKNYMEKGHFKYKDDLLDLKF